MSKAAEAFRTISEVADELEVPKHVLRFWEVKFPQIRPMKRGGGRRYYRPEDMILLRGIQRLLHAEGYTIKGVQKILREQGIDQVKVHGVDAAEAASTSNVATAKPASKQDAKLKVQASGRIRDLPKSAKTTLSVAGPRATLPAVHHTTLEHALRELEACRAVLTAPFQSGVGPVDVTVRPARTVRSTR